MTTVLSAPTQLAWPWPHLTGLTDTLMPGDIVIVTAATGAGKTTFTLGALEGIAAEHGVLYFGTERTPDELKAVKAAETCGFRYADVRRGRWDECGKQIDGQGRLLGAERAKARYDQAVADFEAGPFKNVVFMPDMNPAPSKICRAMARAHERGMRCTVIDHVGHVALDEYGRVQKNIGLEKFLHELKEWAVRYQQVVILTVQNNRDDRSNANKHSRPDLNWLQGSSALEQIASTVLALYRPMRPDVTDEERKAVKLGHLDEQELLVENITACCCLKHRDEGAKVGRHVFFKFERGRLFPANAPRAAAAQPVAPPAPPKPVLGGPTAQGMRRAADQLTTALLGAA